MLLITAWILLVANEKECVRDYVDNNDDDVISVEYSPKKVVAGKQNNAIR